MMLRAAGAAKRLVYRNLALLLLALSLCEVALGMEFRHIGIQQGLSNRKVYAIASDSSGFMWFATRMGIDRYDGSEFTHYTLESTTPNEVSNYTNTYCITTDNKGVVWALSPNGRLFSYSERYGKFILKETESEMPE